MIESLTGQGINVRHACRTLEVSESGYYGWKGRPGPPRTLRRIWLAGEIADVYKASGGTYGALRVTAELRYGGNIVVGHNAVESIMRELGIKGLPTRRRPKGARLAQVVSLDLVRRSFRRDRPNVLWLTDITSDHGEQFTSWAFSQRVRDAGIAPSMGAAGSCFDNAMMEAIWARLQVELLNRRRWKTRVELASAIHDYIEHFHNTRRRHSALGMRTPAEIETEWLTLVNQPEPARTAEVAFDVRTQSAGLAPR